MDLTSNSCPRSNIHGTYMYKKMSNDICYITYDVRWKSPIIAICRVFSRGRQIIENINVVRPSAN